MELNIFHLFHQFITAVLSFGCAIVAASLVDVQEQNLQRAFHPDF
jgi:hypothetical protein